MQHVARFLMDCALLPRFLPEEFQILYLARPERRGKGRMELCAFTSLFLLLQILCFSYLIFRDLFKSMYFGPRLSRRSSQLSANEESSSAERA